MEVPPPDRPVLRAKRGRQRGGARDDGIDRVRRRQRDNTLLQIDQNQGAERIEYADCHGMSFMAFPSCRK